jgi:hypothetical protein
VESYETTIYGIGSAMASHGIYLIHNGSTGGGYGRGAMDDFALDTKNRSHWISSPTLPFIFITNMQDGERCGAISLIQRVQESKDASRNWF